MGDTGFKSSMVQQPEACLWPERHRREDKSRGCISKPLRNPSPLLMALLNILELPFQQLVVGAC